MTVIGNRPEWVLAMVACFRIGAVALPCTEQLRAKDLALRIAATNPKLILADKRNRAEVEAAGGPEVAWLPDARLLEGPPAEAVALRPEDPLLVTFTSGTS